MKAKKNKAVFLDRDGTIIIDRNHLRTEKGIRLKKGIDSLKLLSDAGFILIIITNQAGIAKGILTEKDFVRIHNKILDRLAARGIHIDNLFYCPHHYDGAVVERYKKRCRCRKPGTLMFEQAIAYHDIVPSFSFMIGDSQCDAESASKLKINSVIVGKKKIDYSSLNYHCVRTNGLNDAVRYILENQKIDGVENEQ